MDPRKIYKNRPKTPCKSPMKYGKPPSFLLFCVFFAPLTVPCVFLEPSERANMAWKPSRIAVVTVLRKSSWNKSFSWKSDVSGPGPFRSFLYLLGSKSLTYSSPAAKKNICTLFNLKLVCGLGWFHDVSCIVCSYNQPFRGDFFRFFFENDFEKTCFSAPEPFILFFPWLLRLLEPLVVFRTHQINPKSGKLLKGYFIHFWRKITRRLNEDGKFWKTFNEKKEQCHLTSANCWFQ